MARRRRVIRFEQGPLAGQYRYVGAGGNCVEPPTGVTAPKMAEQTREADWRTASPKLPGLEGVQGPHIPNCTGRQANADRRMAQVNAFNASRNPWTTPSDITMDPGENFWIGLAVWGADTINDIAPGLIPLITPGDDWDDIEDVLPPPLPPGTPPPPW